MCVRGVLTARYAHISNFWKGVFFLWKWKRKVFSRICRYSYMGKLIWH